MHFQTLLIFIGSPRTGSTLLGQILNYHPECLVATEASFVTKVVKQNMSFKRATKQLKKRASKQFKKGLENDKKYGRTINRYQPKWVPLGNLAKDPDFQKREIKVIGDKKAGGTTQVFIEKPEETIQFLQSLSKIALLQIIRNPVDAALSYMRSHRVEPFKAACEEIIVKTHVAFQLGNELPNRYHTLYYEDLVQNPQKTISEILEWLNIDITDSWLEKISQKINYQNSKNHATQYHPVARALIERYRAHEELGRYIVM